MPLLLHARTGSENCYCLLPLIEHDVRRCMPPSAAGHDLEFCMAPNLHWPDTMFSYDHKTGALEKPACFSLFVIGRWVDGRICVLLQPLLHGRRCLIVFVV